MQHWGEDCWETCSPVASWMMNLLIFTFYVTCNFASISLEFTQAFPQAGTKNDVLVDMPFGHDNHNRDCMLKLKKNFYGPCEDDLAWHENLKRGLLKRRFKALKIDPCLFFKQGAIVIAHVDDYCMLGTSKELIESFATSLRRPDRKTKNKHQQFDDGFDFT